MLHKTRGVVLKVTDYSESSVVVQVFTEKFGLQSYLVNGIKRPRSKIKLVMLQPLHLLEMVVYHKPNGKLQRLAEVRNQPVLQSIPYDVVKSSLALFLNEVLHRSLKTHFEDGPLFEYIFNAVELLDKSNAGLSNFHLYFLMKLSRHLGFYPDRTLEQNASFFDLREGAFVHHQPLHVAIIDESLIADFKKLLNFSFETLAECRISALNRKALLSKILIYYALHIDIGEIKSHSILEEVLG